MDVPVFSRRAGRAAAPLLVAACLAGCGASSGGATTGGATTEASPASVSAAPAIVPATPGTGAATTPAATGAALVDTDELLAVAETLAPPEAQEQIRLTSDASAGIRWTTPITLEAIQEHYAGIVSSAGLQVLLDSRTGGMASLVLGGLLDERANASIQVSPLPGAGHLVLVTVTPA